MDQDELKRILKKVRQLELRTRSSAHGAMSGAYVSKFRGQGLNFEEVREYCAGDEVRSIDWNVTARMDRPFVKVFSEERELTVLLAVDISGSSSYGSTTQAKREFMAEVAGTIAFSAINNGDKVGLLLFTEGTELFLRPSKGRAHGLRMLRELLFFQPKQTGTNIPGALETLGRLHKRRALCFLMSDFASPHTPSYTPENLEPLTSALSLANRRHELTCLHITDPLEAALPSTKAEGARGGWVELEDPETGERTHINLADTAVAEAYAQATAHNQATLKKGLRQCGIPTVPITVGQPYVPALQAYFQAGAA